MVKTIDWKRTIQSDVEAVTKLVRIHSRTALVEFDYENFLFRVGSRSPLPNAAKVAIRSGARPLTGLGVWFTEPPEYLFKLHFDVVPAVVRPPDLADRVVDFGVELAQLRALQRVYRTLCNESAKFDYVASFALSGFVGMEIVSAHARGSRALSVSLVGALQAKYHLFPSLTWSIKGEAAERRLHAWLLSLPAQCSVLLFDTTFSGGGIAKLEKSVRDFLAVAASVPFRRVQILAVTDGSAFTKAIPRAATCRIVVGNRSVRVGTRYLKVPKLLSEDRQDLIGYVSLRADAAMKGGWAPAVVRVSNKRKKLVQVGCTDHLAARFSELVESPPRDRPLVSPEKHTEEALRIVIGHLASKEKKHLTTALLHRRISPTEFALAKNALIKHSQGLLKSNMTRFGIGAH